MSVHVTLGLGAGGPVAIKTAIGPASVDRLRDEAQRLKRAAHPGVVTVVASGPVGEAFELRTRYVGDTLAQWSGSLPHAAGLCAAVGATLADLHEVGLVHGRLDATHVLVGADGRPRLCGLSHPGESVPADDVHALGRLLEHLLARIGAERRSGLAWARSAGGAGPRRALSQIAARALDPVAARRPSARALARSILAAVPGAELPPPSAPTSVSDGADGLGAWLARATAGPAGSGTRRSPASETVGGRRGARGRAAADMGTEIAPVGADNVVGAGGAGPGAVAAGDRARPSPADDQAAAGASATVAAGRAHGVDVWAEIAMSSAVASASTVDDMVPGGTPPSGQTPAGAGAHAGPPAGAGRPTAAGASHGDRSSPSPRSSADRDDHPGRPQDAHGTGDRREQPAGATAERTDEEATSSRRVGARNGLADGRGTSDRREQPAGATAERTDDEATSSRRAEPGGTSGRRSDDARTGAVGAKPAGAGESTNEGDADPAVAGGAGSGAAPSDPAAEPSLHQLGGLSWLDDGRGDPPPVTAPVSRVTGPSPLPRLGETRFRGQAASDNGGRRRPPDRPGPGRHGRDRSGRRGARRATALRVGSACVVGLTLVAGGTLATRGADDEPASPAPAAAGSARPSGCRPPAVPAADIDGDGCPEPIHVDGRIVEAGGRRWSLGEPGDVAAVGDWDCDGAASPALLRPRTGDVFVFPRWASAHEPVTVDALDAVGGGTAIRARREPDGCDTLVVERAAGEVAVEVGP